VDNESARSFAVRSPDVNASSTACETSSISITAADGTRYKYLASAPEKA
jgi:hypothetical protein